MDKIIVYTDGASKGNGSNDSKCGWGVLLSYKGVEIANKLAEMEANNV